jgi:hypothetical protein
MPAKRRKSVRSLGYGVAVRRVLGLPPPPKTEKQLQREEDAVIDKAAALFALGHTAEAMALLAKELPHLTVRLGPT